MNTTKKNDKVDQRKADISILLNFDTATTDLFTNTTKWYFTANNSTKYNGTYDNFLQNQSRNRIEKLEWQMYVDTIIQELLKTKTSKNKKIAEILIKQNHHSWIDDLSLRFLPVATTSLIQSKKNKHIITYDVDYTFGPVPLSNNTSELSGISVTKQYNDGNFVKILEAVYGFENNIHLSQLMIDDKDTFDKLEQNTVRINTRTTSLLPM